MQVEAIYEDGVIRFTQPLRFKHRKFEVVVSIPEQEVLPGSNAPPMSDLSVPAQAWLKQLDSISQHILSMPEDELPELTAKQSQYMDAFQMREDR